MPSEEFRAFAKARLGGAQSEPSEEFKAFARSRMGGADAPAQSEPSDEFKAFARARLGAVEPELQATQPKTYTQQHTYAPRPYSKGLENVLKHTGGAVMGALEKLDRPRSMLVSGIQAVTGDRPASDIVEAAKGNIHPSFSEVLPDMNVPAPKWIDPDDDGQVNLKHAVGFGLDVVADPLNAVGVGVLTKGGKSARALSMMQRMFASAMRSGRLPSCGVPK